MTALARFWLQPWPLPTAPTPRSSTTLQPDTGGSSNSLPSEKLPASTACKIRSYLRRHACSDRRYATALTTFGDWRSSSLSRTRCLLAHIWPRVLTCCSLLRRSDSLGQVAKTSCARCAHCSHSYARSRKAGQYVLPNFLFEPGMHQEMIPRDKNNHSPATTGAGPERLGIRAIRSGHRTRNGRFP